MNARALAALCCLSCLAGAACAEPEELTATNFFRRDAGGSSGQTTAQGATSGTTGSSTTATGPTVGTDMTTATTSAGAGSGGGGAGGAGTSTAGAAGSGQATSTGAGGTAGTAGSGGSAGGATDAGPDRVTPPTMGLSILYVNAHASAMADSIKCQTIISYVGTTGMGNIPLSELTIRYYFTDEVATFAPAVTINSGNLSGVTPYRDLMGAVTTHIVPLTDKKPTADTYVELGFMAAVGSIAPGDKAVVDWQYHGSNYQMVTQTNDWSYDMTKTTATAWDHIVLARNGSIIYGTPP